MSKALPASQDLGQDQESHLLPIFIVFSTLPLIAVTLRILARRTKQMNLWWDDYLILVASVRSHLVTVNRLGDADHVPRLSLLFNWLSSPKV